MNVWALSTAAAPAWVAPLGALVGAIGAPEFAQQGLVALNEADLRAASWSVYRVGRERAPVLHLSGSVGVPDTTRDCFAAYREGLYRRDSSFDSVRPGHAAVLRMHADEAPSRDHREAIYLRHGVVERLSVVRRESEVDVFAVNLYRHAHQGRFGAGEVEAFAALAPLLLAAVQRHLALQPAAVSDGEPGAVHPRPGLRGALRARCAELTERELDVCERLLRGLSYDGIAADLGLSTATVKTYRARAFERLGLHFKSELFAAFVPRG